MTQEKRKVVSELLSSLKQDRDELRLRLHLGKEEVKQEFQDLEKRLTELNDRFQPTRDAAGETAEQIWESLKLVGEEIRDGYQRIRKSL
ncbi:MAG: hypothetical protein RIK87_14315 [Fuerstiella sp.]